MDINENFVKISEESKNMILDTLMEYKLAIEVELEIKNQLTQMEIAKENFENDVWLSTNFPKILKANNDRTRKAYVEKEMATNFIDKTPALKNELSFVQNYIKYLSKALNIIGLTLATDEDLEKSFKKVSETSILMQKFGDKINITSDGDVNNGTDTKSE